MENQVEHNRSADPCVWILVLHWQGPPHTEACLASLQTLRYPNFKILLVDNGSPDKSGPSIVQKFPQVELLALPENLGFAGGCNAGIRYCQEQGASWIWLLNNDTQVNPEVLSQLMSAAAEAPRAGALGATVYTCGKEREISSGPGHIDFWRAKSSSPAFSGTGLDPISCQWLSGCNLLLRSAALEQVGIFDEDYFLYFEDTDLCYRLCQASWQCLLVPAASIEHIGSASTQGERSYWRAYYHTRNRLLFFLNHLHGLARLPALLSIAGHLLRHALVLPWRGTAGRKQLRAEYLGFRDYCCQRLGKARCLDWCDKQPS